MNFILLINVKMPTIFVGILTFVNRIYTPSEYIKHRKIVFSQYFTFYPQLKFHTQLSWAWETFYKPGARFIIVSGILKFGPAPEIWELDMAYMGLDARKPVFGGLRTTQAQTSLRIRAVWSAPLLFAIWKVSYVNLLQVKSQFSS